MSLKTWKDEFYPADAFAGKLRPKLASAKHSLKKWEGALKKNLEKHHVRIGKMEYDYFITIRGEESEGCLEFSGGTCALCIHSISCSKCPIVAAVGRVCRKEFAISMRHDPKPMVRLLRKTVKYLEEEKARKAK